MEKVSYGPIGDKLEAIQIEGQAKQTCTTDCQRHYWVGNSFLLNIVITECTRKTDNSAHFTVKF